MLAVCSAVLARWLSRLSWMLDVPNARSLHRRPIPRSGGIAIVITFFLGVTIHRAIGEESQIAEPYFLAFFFGTFMIAAVSVVDDLTTLNFPSKLGAQVLAAAIVLPFGLVVHEAPIPILGTVGLGMLGYLLTLLWIVGLTNTFNFMDGADGLAAGQAVIGALFWGFTASLQGSHFSYLTAWIVAAATLGFLVHNFPRARIFMGDTGSQFLGFTFGVLAIIGGRYDTAPLSLLVMGLLFFNMIWDTFFTFVRRVSRGAHVLRSHRSHLYQLLIRSGSSPSSVTLLHYCVGCAQGIGAILLINVFGDERLLVFVPFILFQAGYTVFVLRQAKRARLEVD